LAKRDQHTTQTDSKKVVIRYVFIPSDIFVLFISSTNVELNLYVFSYFESTQFRYDVKVNPLDVEEIVWDIACQNRLKLQNPDYNVNTISLPAGKTDRRRIMVSVIFYY
jgi:hypothetical protein